jgi:oligoendopeptidase F
MTRRLPLLLALAIPLFCLSTEDAMADELPAYTPDSNADRAEVPDAYKWDLGKLFADDDAWEAAATELVTEIDGLNAYQGRLADGPTLLECLDRYIELHGKVNSVTLYANLQNTTDSGDAAVQARHQQALSVLDQFMGTASFLRNEILALSDKEMGKAFKKAPALLERHGGYIEGLRRRKHTMLSPDAEQVLSLAGDNLWAEIDLNEIPAPVESAFHALLDDIPFPMVHDEEGNEVQLNFSNYGKFRRSPDRAVREEAVNAMMATLKQYEHAFAATLGGQAEFSVFLAKSRGYDTALEAYLDKDNLNPAVYHNLISTVNANLEPLHRYISLRKKLQGYDAIYLHDMYVPIVEGVDQEIPFEQAQTMLVEALAPMGPEYIEVLSKGLDPAEGWLDLYPSSDKRSGAFSASTHGVEPYVMMNYQDSMNDMSTLAHEYGHAMHSYLSMEHQGYMDYRYVPFLAEIASTANEVLVEEHLLAQATDPKVKASILADRLAGMRGTIYRQALFAEFELALHTFVEEGTPVTADLLNTTYGDLVTKYYGPDYALGEHHELEWAYIPHFYWKYYVFTYATGLSSGITIAQKVREGEANRDAYLGMLKAGCSAPPLEILAGAGVDLTTPEPIEAAMKRFDATVTELEALVAEIEAAEAAQQAEEGAE